MFLNNMVYTSTSLDISEVKIGTLIYHIEFLAIAIAHEIDHPIKSMSLSCLTKQIRKEDLFGIQLKIPDELSLS
jgi:hypothetical protein